MKRFLMILPVLLLLTGCTGGTQNQEESTSSAVTAASAPSSGSASSEAKTNASAAKTQDAPESVPENGIWTKEEMPVSVRYDRMWVYSASGETKDPEVLKELVDAVRALEIGEKSEWITEDYTDILSFRFADGDTLRLEFEDQSWVRADGERYEVSGLDRLRAILETLLPDIQ